MNASADNLLLRLQQCLSGCDAIIRDPLQAGAARERAEQIRRVLLTAKWAAFKLAEIPLPPLPEPVPTPETAPQ